MKNIAKNSLLNIIRTLMVNFIPLLTYMYGARIFLAEGNGQIWFCQSYTSYFVMLGMLGIEKYGIREISKVKNNKRELSYLAQEIMMLNFFSCAVSLFLFFISITIVPRLYSYKILLIINSLSIVLTAMGINWLYVAEEDYSYITIKSCIVSSISLIALFLFVHGKDDIYLFVFIQIIASTGSNILNFIHSRKYIDYKWFGNYHPFRHIKNVLILFLMTFFIEIFTHADTTMIGFLSGDFATGLYSSAHKVSGVLTAVITAAVMVIMPSMSVFAKEKKSKEIIELSKTTINMVLMISIPFTIGLIMLSSEMNYIFSGAGFEGATLTGQILAGRVLLSSLNGFFVMYLFIPLEKEKWNLISTGAAALSNMIINFILIPILDQNGAALGTVFAEGLELLINLHFLKKIMPVKPIFKDIWNYLLSALPIIPLSMFFFNVIENIILRVFLTVVCSGTIYFLLLYWIKNYYFKKTIERVHNSLNNC